MRAFFLTTVRWGAFHGDVHAGNMMLLRDGRIGVIDWGIVGRLDPSTHRFFISLLSAAMGNEAAWPVVTKHITDVYGPAIGIAVGLSDDELPAFFRSIVEPALTRPFGEVSLAGIMQTIQLQMAKAQGVEAHQRSVRAILRRLRTQRRVRRMADESGRPDVRVRPGHVPAGQAVDVLRALRPHVRLRGADPQRPRLHLTPARGRGHVRTGRVRRAAHLAQKWNLF